ncbi:MAG: hypothetical protein U0T83_05275 [Bacteriovoracaceae bacterium]
MKLPSIRSDTIVAGLSFSRGRENDYYLCLMEYFEDSENSGRWALSKLVYPKESKATDESSLSELLRDYKVKQIVTDIPLNMPACYQCTLKCPGEAMCSEASVKYVREEVDKILSENSNQQNFHPKTYEKHRLQSLEVTHQNDIFAKQSDQYILSRSFKRRLKKGYLPYWNRPIDFWVWINYYDQLLNMFNYSYDSFGLTPYISIMRINYFKKFLNNNINFYESDIYIILLELARAGIITKKQLLDLKDLEFGAEARLNIVKKIEEKIKLFIYEHDLVVLVNDSRAFAAFILSLSGMASSSNKTVELPSYCNQKEINFLVPSFY